VFSRSFGDDANQFAWRRVWAGVGQHGLLDRWSAWGVVVPRAVFVGRSASVRLTATSGHRRVPAAALIIGWSVQRTDRVPRRWIYYRYAAMRVCVTATAPYQPRRPCTPREKLTGQRIGQQRSRLQDDQSHWPPLVSHSASPLDRSHVAISLSRLQLLTERRAVNYYYYYWRASESTSSVLGNWNVLITPPAQLHSEKLKHKR